VSVLRAPWAGLSLNDLHALVDGAPYATLPSLLQDGTRLNRLSADGQKVLARVWPVLEAGLSQRGRLGLRQLIEGCWLALGGVACYDLEGLQNAELVFALLESLEEGGDLPTLSMLEQGLDKLFSAADTEADGGLQVMTIHKAKGLEFDHVILPGLGRKPRGDDSPLLRWLEHPEHGLLLAPIAPRDGSEQDPVYKMIGQLEKEKQQLETVRLLYVAATRAKNRLYLLAHAKENSKAELKPERGSLLETLWPIVEGDFIASAQTSSKAEELTMSLPLRRLPLDWQQPDLQAAPLPDLGEVGRASDLDREEELIFTGWENQAQRHIGTIVHNLLEMIVKLGHRSWDKTEEAMIQRRLAALGVPAKEQPAAVTAVSTAVETTLASKKGRWILDQHQESACELELTGVVGDKLIHAIIDRTFIDERGVRWVIDYKVSRPKQGETLGAFFNSKSEQYRKQLLSYKLLLQQMDPQREIYTALYFPLVDGWCEVAC